MKALKVLALMHEDLVPPEKANKLGAEEREPYKTEYDVVTTLRKSGHDVLALGVRDEISPVRVAVSDFQPDIAFNLLEEFAGNAAYDYHVVSLLEMTAVPYTGCNPRGLMLARDKALGKKILLYHRIAVPDFAVFPLGRKVQRPKKLGFPLIVKSLIEEASLGISQASLVDSDDKLRERVQFIHERLRTDAIAEAYVDGRELYVSVLGNRRLKVMPVWELIFSKMAADAPLIATRRVKWDLEYQRKRGIKSQRAEALPPGVEERLYKVSKRIYRLLGLSGYARLDFRLGSDGEVYFLEANPNPQIAADEDFADSARAAGMSYERLLQKIVMLGLHPGLDVS